MKRALESFASHVPLLVLMFILGAGFFLTAGDFPSGVWCFFKRVFGFDCPGCGLTHAFLAIPRGNFAAAWSYNPGAFPLYALFFAAFIRQGTEVFGRLLTTPYLRNFSRVLSTLTPRRSSLRSDTPTPFARHPEEKFDCSVVGQMGGKLQGAGRSLPRYLFVLSQISAATLFIQWVPKVVSYFQDHSVAGVFARLMGFGR